MQAPILDTNNGAYKPFESISYDGTLYIYEGAKGFDDVDSEWYKELVQVRRWKIEYMEIPQPNNEIWYTTTDGNIVEPYDLPTDNTLLSNTYENDKGVMIFEKDLDEIPTNIFSYKSVESVSLPSSITTIGDRAFEHCTKLNSIKLPDGLISIKSYAFGNTQKLREIVLPNTLMTIGDGAFSGASLFSLVIPNSLTSLPIDTFTNCYFSEIIIPSSITSIGDSCFAYCHYLRSITFNTNEPPFIDNNAFNNVGVWEKEKPKVIYVPQGANIEAYQNSECATLLANDWTIEYIKETPNSNEILYKSADGNIINPTHLESLPTIVSNTYKNDIGTIVCESDITELGYECFDSNTNLIEINLPSSVTYLAQWTFYGTENLYSITFNSIEAPELFSESVWSNIGNTTSEEKVIRIPNNANTDSYINGEHWYSIYNKGYVLKNFDGELLYSTQ